MTNASKQKGTRFESDVVTYLQGHGFPFVERRALFGQHDKGDVAGMPGTVIECKAEARIELAGYLDELAAEKSNAGAHKGVVIVKRRGKGVERAYVVMELRDWVGTL